MYLKTIGVMLCLLIFPALASAQSTEISSATARKWYAPDAVTLQFAGNIGMFSIAPSYSFAKDKLHAELFYGYVPRFDAEEALHVLTLKGIYMPFREVSLKGGFSLTPLRLGLGVSYYFRSQFSTNWSNAYPTNDYYWWTSSLRLTGSFGPALNYSLPQSKSFSEVSLYGELNTYDLIVTSAYKDKSLTTWDILSLSLGVRASFR